MTRGSGPQTHATLAQFLLEECYEAYDAIAAGDLAALREELGDVLLQVVLHARLAEELPEDERWNVDDVAGGLVEKMIRRNPHVFADTTVGSIDEIIDQLGADQAGREGPRLGAGRDRAGPAGAVARGEDPATGRSGRAGRPAAGARTGDDEARLGARLLDVVVQARADGLDAEAALRRAALAYADAVRAVEAAAGAVILGLRSSALILLVSPELGCAGPRPGRAPRTSTPARRPGCRAGAPACTAAVTRWPPASARPGSRPARRRAGCSPVNQATNATTVISAAR